MSFLESGALLAAAARVARGLDLLATLQIFGSLLFCLLIAGALSSAAGARQRAWTLRLLRAALGLKLAALAAWLPLQAASMAGEHSLASLGLVAWHTQFGQAALARTALLIAALWVAGRAASPLRLLLAAGLAAAAVALQALLGHASAQQDWVLMGLVALHILAAGAWLGGLLPLWHWLGTAAPADARRAVARFSWLGLVAVSLIALTAWWQAEQLIGGLAGWLGTPYGHMALLKTLGFALLLGFAALNRFVFSPRLAAARPQALRLSVAWEAAAGLLVLALATALASQPPAIHLQPHWPLPWQPDPLAMEKPWIGIEIRRALVLAGTLLLGLAGLLWQRTRIALPVLAVLTLFLLPLPNWQHFVQPAHEGSFYRSDTGYTAASIVRGQELALRHCTQECARKTDNPADLTPYNIWQRSDGDLFDWLTRVFDRIGHSPFAHGTIATFDTRQRWQLIDYFRARVSGAALRQTQQWPYAVPPPNLPLLRRDLPALDLAQLRGHFVYLMALPSAQPDWRPPVLAEHRVVTVALHQKGEANAPDPQDSHADCQALGTDAWQALAIAGGRDAQALAGTAFLIDAQNLLRLQVAPGESAPSLADWRRELQVIASTPLPSRAPPGHAH